MRNNIYKMVFKKNAKKENIKKNNMKKLVLSAVLGVFCYCINNAMKKTQPVEVKDINYVLNIMIQGQIMILTAKLKMFLAQNKKIYSTIKDQEGKVTKKNLLNFIQNQIPQPEQNEEKFKDDIKEIEQYFHLEEINDDDECNEGNLTEIFWDKGEKGEGGEEGEGKIKDVVDEIKSYFITIIFMEKIISDAFKKYYEAKKTEKGEVEKVEDVVIEEIMNECCGGESDDLGMNFLTYLKNLMKGSEENKQLILTPIRKRITLKNKITKEDFKSFLKQKIGIEEKKEVEPKEEEKKQEGGCPCCDCWEKNKNIEVIEV